MGYFKFGFCLLFFCVSMSAFGCMPPGTLRRLIFGPLAGLIPPDNIIPFGMAPETLVKGVCGYTPIGEMKAGDWVIGFNDDAISHSSKVMYTQKNETYAFVRITIGQEVINVEIGQFFCSSKAGWVKAWALDSGDSLVTLDGSVVIDNVKITYTGDEPVMSYSFALDDTNGFFFISPYDILTYNFTEEKIFAPVRRVAGHLVKNVVVSVAVELIKGQIC